MSNKVDKRGGGGLEYKLYKERLEELGMLCLKEGRLRGYMTLKVISNPRILIDHYFTLAQNSWVFRPPFTTTNPLYYPCIKQKPLSHGNINCLQTDL